MKRADFTLQSRVPLEGSRTRRVGVLGAVGMAERLDQHARKVRTTEVRGWPLCDVCTRTRTLWLSVAAVLFFGGLLVFAGSLVAGILAEKGTMRALAGVAVAGFVLMIVSASPSRRRHVTGDRREHRAARRCGARREPEPVFPRRTSASLRAH
ncbi:hypothetical protein SZMC14600_16691 [Saccharomonospora azurea SZMC 14600]|nr:hypothetical protein SZMC14600_16691 [Saccharomonospora azurea SZMC 14600]